MTKVVPGATLRRDPVVAAAATPDGRGYWLVTSRGQVLAFGDAESYGSITKPIRAHVVAIVATDDGKGYWIACSTGGVFNFGDANFYGSARAGTPGLPIVAAAATPDSRGYWLVDSNGTVFSFGDALLLPTFSPVRATSPVVGIAVTPGGTGAWMAERNGTVLNFGTASRPRLDHRLADRLTRHLHRCNMGATSEHSRLRPRRGQRQGGSNRRSRLLRLQVRQAPGRPHRLHRPHP